MTKATLAGKPLLNTDIVGWELREGVKPVVRTVDMAPLDAIAVSTTGGPVSLLIQPEEGNPVKVQGLWVLNIQPGPNKYISKVTIADRRWLWSYSWILKRYNHRRNVGTKRLVANDQVPQVNAIAPSIAYWEWSLDSGRPWASFSMLTDLLKVMSEKEKSFTGGFEFTIDQRIGNKIKSLPIEDITLDDPGDQALSRALSYLPEAMVYVDYDAKVIVTSRATGDEKAAIKAILPEMVDEGHTDLVENSLIRPKEIDVLFTIESEVLLNFTENALEVGATTTNDQPDSRTLFNVLPSSDYQLTTGDGVPSDRAPICQGTYITFGDAFNYWGNLPLILKNGSARKLDHDILQRAFVPQMDLWAALGIAGDRPDNQGTLKNWPARIAACQNHYRMTFQISSTYMDRVLSVRAYRAGTIDPVRRTRGPALAYGDYCILYTQRSIWKNIAQKKPLDFAINKTAYPSSGVLDSTAEPSPCDVQIIDSDQGVIHLAYKSNPIYGMNETILPSQLASDSIPTSDITQRTRPISFDCVIKGQKPPRLSASYKCKILVTMVPAAPNSTAQLFRVKIKPNDVASMMPDSQAAGLTNAQGPTMEIRIGAGVEVARVAWNDARASDIDKLFGVIPGEPNLAGLVINEGEPAGLENGASLNAIAKAAAARVYASLCDRFEGSTAGYMNGQVRPAGWLGNVRHELRPDGQAVTVLEMPSAIPQFSLFAFLDSSTRQSLLGLVQPL